MTPTREYSLEEFVTVDLSQTNIDPNDPQYQPMLEDLQGNILKSHGRDYSAHIFIKFKPDLNAAKKWISNFAENFVTSAKKQLDDSARYRRNNRQVSGGLFANFFLSARGYQSLGFNLVAATSGKFPSATFIAGLKAYQKQLYDPPVSEWEEGFQDQIHALILLADDNHNHLEEQAKKVMEDVGAVADIVNTQAGIALRNEKKQVIEHFGFTDGVSQPLFLKRDIDRAKEQGIDQWDPSAPLELVLIQDPFGQGEDSFGSYCVFRKLEQDVQGFKTKEQELANTLGLSGIDAQRAGALVVGRFRDGTPVTLSCEEESAESNLNNFNYAGDKDGSRCPFHSHTRKANPRGDTNDTGETLEKQRTHRIARRAISYGETPTIRNKSQSKPERFHHQLRHVKEVKLQLAEDQTVGLLFLCVQSDLFNQFMFMQKSWANNQNFVNYQTGLDTVTGQGKPQAGGQKWPKEWGQPDTVQFDFSNFVTMKGGEFFFAPSMSFLKTITSQPVT